MYIFKNALKCISRSKGRNVLIGIIALIIAISACIGLCIRQASENAKNSTLEGMTITATISFDRQSIMNGIGNPSNMPDFSGGFDREEFESLMGSSSSSLTLDEYLKYAEASSVKDFYYTLTIYLDGSENFYPVTSDSSDDFMGGMDFGGMMGGMNFGSSGEFSVVGYSKDSAMTSFINGTASIIEGSVFDEGTSEYVCIISEELALYNSLEVRSVITFVNPSDENQTFDLTVVGIYSDTESNSFSSMFGSSQDPANKIYMSANTVNAIVEQSENMSEESGKELSSSLSATYVIGDLDGYYKFEEEVRTLGLDENYTVSSPDLTSYENSLTPLKTLSTIERHS